MRYLIFILLFASIAYSQMPTIEPGVSHDLAKWRAARYSDIRYKLNLTLEKMSPVLKGTIEIRVTLAEPTGAEGARLQTPQSGKDMLIILDWRKIPGHEELSTISDVSINGTPKLLSTTPSAPTNDVGTATPPNQGGEFRKPPDGGTPNGNTYQQINDHLIFTDGVRAGENVIKLDFTSPILTSGAAITRYIDKEDGSEYLYSLFVPSDASTAFPVFDQPDLKAKFTVIAGTPGDWEFISNETSQAWRGKYTTYFPGPQPPYGDGTGHLAPAFQRNGFQVKETKPISTYVFAFTAGPWARFIDAGSTGGNATVKERATAQKDDALVDLRVSARSVYVRKSQAAKFKPHAAEVFRLRDEAIKYLETYFDYKFPWPKYDIVLIPEFPFGGMEHAGETFLRESGVIFPTEPTANDHISRANLIFHETAHQWFGDCVTMRWFDDLWLKEGFAEFMAYKTLEHVMPQYNAWKIFYERIKQSAYATDSTKGTTPIYQEINNLSAAKSAYGNIVYRKAPSFLRQAEFYLGEDKFQTAVRAFLKKHEFANAGWEDLVKEFAGASGKDLQRWAGSWIKPPGLGVVRLFPGNNRKATYEILSESIQNFALPDQRVGFLVIGSDGSRRVQESVVCSYSVLRCGSALEASNPRAIVPNYQDYGYGIFILDDKSRDYVLKNIQNEQDPFLRSMEWGALWDSVREAELDPKDYVELVIRNLSTSKASTGDALTRSGKSDAFTRFSYVEDSKREKTPKGVTLTETDETTIQLLLARVGTAMSYYLPDKQRDEIAPRLENMLLDRMQHASTSGQRITFYRAFINTASTPHAREVLKQMLKQTAASGGNPSVNERANSAATTSIPLKTKDRFDIVTHLIILGDPDAPKLLADLEKTETGDDAKRYAYAAHAGFATAENKAKFWNDFVNNKDISESWIEAAIGPFNSIRHASLTQPYLERALAELPTFKRTRKIFFVNNWLGAFLSGQRDQKALDTVNKFLADSPSLDRDLRLKILENVDVIERAVKIRAKFQK